MCVHIIVRKLTSLYTHTHPLYGVCETRVQHIKEELTPLTPVVMVGKVKTKSIGVHLLEQVCNAQLTVPMLARALGMWLGDLERIMVENDPPPTFVADLVACTKQAWMLGVPELEPDQVWRWIADYDVADSTERVTVTDGDWQELPVLTTADPDPGTDRLAWCIRTQAFTMAAYEATWRIRNGDLTPEDEIRPTRWRPHQETVNGVRLMVWRWNPLNKSRGGRPAPLRFNLPPIVSLESSVKQEFRRRIRVILERGIAAGLTQVTAQDVAQALHGRPNLGSNTMQAIRNAMKDLGWVYVPYDKIWKLATSNSV